MSLTSPDKNKNNKITIRNRFKQKSMEYFKILKLQNELLVSLSYWLTVTLISFFALLLNYNIILLQLRKY